MILTKWLKLWGPAIQTETEERSDGMSNYTSSCDGHGVNRHGVHVIQHGASTLYMFLLELSRVTSAN